MGRVRAMSVTLRLVRPEDTGLRAQLMAHRLPAAQDFALPARDTLPLADADPGRTSVAILDGDLPVGMFQLDRGGFLPEITDRVEGTLLLRAFYVAPPFQGRGLATRAVAAVPDFVRATFPDVDRVLLTVNHANPAAARCYLRGGFTDTGQDYLVGRRGPQDVFVLQL